ncbi:MAG: hypothetical protein MAG431_02127 [Chloroflexi bacterium]|nr:hypothetical protein [Chloroflexota bacterium]
MPLNYPQLQPQIKELGETSVIREDRLRAMRQRANQLLDDCAQDTDALRAKVGRAVELRPRLRCALPVSEPLTASYPLPEVPADALLLAADGSQINPDPHAAADYYLINVGGIVLDLSQSAAPETFIETKLKYGDDMYTKYGSVSSGHVALERDLAERKYLAQWAEEYLARVSSQNMGALLARYQKTQNPPLMITLTDGPLELWGMGDTSGKDSAAIQEAFNEYMDSLHQLIACGAVTAGYVDKPQADLVVRLVEIARLEEDHLSEAGRNRQFRGVSDADLFTPRLGPGERSAVFGIQSQKRSEYPPTLTLHFFYLNVGRENHPWLARVEIPAWVAEDRAKLDALHAVLIHQCQTLGAKGYPYLLHRSHEIAVVTYEEKDLLTNMINQERRRRGIAPGQPSHKQELKNHDGRTSYQ